MKHHFVGVKPLKVQFKGTPITDNTFEKQGWTKIECIDDEEDDDSRFDDYEGHPLDDFFENMGFELPHNDDEEDIPEEYFDELDEMDDLFEDELSLPYPNQGEWESEYYFWVLKIPKDWYDDDTLTLISTTSDHHIPGFKKGEYIVELYRQDGLGTCISEEEIEILYRALSGEDIYE